MHTTQPQLAPPLQDLDGLFRAHASYVARVVVRLLGRDDEVDDVVQDVFLDAISGLASLREEAAIRGWLATVAARKVARRLRKRKLRAWLRFETERTYEDVAAPGASQEERTLLAQVYQLLDELPVHDRLAWSLRHIEGEPLERVALMCGCSLATAKRRIGAAQLELDRVIHP